MRVILFRGKRIDNGEWVCSGNLIHFNEGDQHFIANLNDKCITTHDENDHIIAIEDTRIYKVIPETVGQYTGLTKNGNKIFEGDVFAWNDNEIDEITGKPYPDEISVVCFDDKKSAFVSKTLNGGCEGLYETISDKNSRYIGNIHDNPELLKGGG